MKLAHVNIFAASARELEWAESDAAYAHNQAADAIL